MKYIDISKYKVQKEELRPYDAEFLSWIKSRISKCIDRCESCELMIDGSYNDKDTYEYFIKYHKIPENNN